MLPPLKRPSPLYNDRPAPPPVCTPSPFTKPEVADDETGNGIAPICGGGGGQAAERWTKELSLPGAVPLTARKSPSLDVDSGDDEFDLSCDAATAAAAAAVLDEDDVPDGHGLPSLTSTGTATRFGGELTAADELFCWS